MPPVVEVVWYGQAGFVLRGWDGTAVGIDLFLSPHELRLFDPPCLDSVGVRLDVVACTHEHGDHLDRDLLPRLAARFPDLEVVVPEPLVPMASALVPTDVAVRGLRPGRSHRFGEVEILAVRAIHGVTVDEGYHDGGAEPRFVGYVLRFDGGPTVYHAGDSLISSSMIEQLRSLTIDVALLPVNGRDFYREAAGIVGNLTAVEAVRVAEAIGASTRVPMHHDLVRGNTETAGACADAARLTGASVHVLNLAPLRPCKLS